MPYELHFSVLRPDVALQFGTTDCTSNVETIDGELLSLSRGHLERAGPGHVTVGLMTGLSPIQYSTLRGHAEISIVL